MIADAVFYVIALFCIAGALAVVFNRNLFHSVVILGFTFLSFGILYMLLGANLVGVIQLLVYVGGVTMLLLFVIMLTRPDNATGFGKIPGPWSYLRGLSLTNILVGVLMLALFGILSVQFISADWRVVGSVPDALNEVPQPTSVAYIGELLLTQFALPFEMASVLLLAALIGAVVLGRTDDASLKSPAEKAVEAARRRASLGGTPSKPEKSKPEKGRGGVGG